jgi:wobble nucleotide-excising tRNase
MKKYNDLKKEIKDAEEKKKQIAKLDDEIQKINTLLQE